MRVACKYRGRMKEDKEEMDGRVMTLEQGGLFRWRVRQHPWLAARFWR